MYRGFLVTSTLIVAAAVAAQADAQRVASYGVGSAASQPNLSGIDLDFGMRAYHSPDARVTDAKRWNVDQILRWGDVGKCVATHDHNLSLSYVSAKRGSAQALAAKGQLKPVFTTCLTGSGVVNKYNEKLRRAAVADAIRMTLASN